MRAVGAYIFAGGFTVGVKNAGYEVLAHLEGGPYGVSSAKLNWPDLSIHYPEDHWPLERYRGVDLVYCNPPCAVFSPMGIAMTRGKGAWRTDPRTSCWYRAFALLDALRPGALAIESVTQAYTTGRPMIDELTKRALLLGYSVTHLLLDAKWTGLPQSRKRFFFIAHRAPLLVGYQHNWAPPPTVGEVLELVDEPGPWTPHNPRFDDLVRRTPPGSHLSATWEADSPPETRQINLQGKTVGRPSFGDYRPRLDRLLGAFIADKVWHPTESRRLGFEEMKAVCGYPPEFQLDGPVSGFASLLARAVMPPVGEWLARALVATLAAPPAADRTRLRVTRVDVREPDRPPVDLTAEYLTPEGRVRLRTADHLERPLPAIGGPSLEDQFPAEATPPPREARRAAPPMIPPAVAPVPLSVAPTAVSGVAADDAPPREGEGSGRYIQRVWLTGRYSPAEIVALVHQHYAGRKTTVSDVNYQYYALRRAGVPDVPAWPRKQIEKKAREPAAPEKKSPAPAMIVTAGPRALVTGMTAMQCGSDRTPLKLANVGTCWAEALRRLGFAVEHRRVRVDEADWREYRAVVVGIAPPKSIVASNTYAALRLLRQRPDAAGFVDDWQTNMIQAGFRSHTRPDRLWRVPIFRDHKLAQRFSEEIEAEAERWRAGAEVPIPLVTCTHGAGADLSLLRVRGRLVPMDPTPVRKRYVVPIDAVKERRWLWASLIKKFDQLTELTERSNWPVLAYGSADREGSGFGKYGARSLPRVPEPELIPEYARSWGIITPAHVVSGSGWWRVRYEIARDVGSVVSGPVEEARLFGSSYEAAVDPRAVEALDDDQLAELAAAQRAEFDALAWDEAILLSAWRDLLVDRGVKLP